MQGWRPESLAKGAAAVRDPSPKSSRGPTRRQGWTGVRTSKSVRSRHSHLGRLQEDGGQDRGERSHFTDPA